MSIRFVWVAGLMMAALAMPAGQNQQAPPAPDQTVVRITVALVQVDAVVTDSKGKHIADLTPEDFEIKQDGKVQKITHFSYVATATPVKPAPKTKQEDKLAPPLPPVVRKASDVKRTAAMVVDDLGLSFESIEWVRQALRKFVDEQMQPGDLVAIVRTGGGMGALEQFTSDKRVLRAAIDALRWNFRGRVGISSFRPMGESETEGGAEALSREQDYMEEHFSVGTLGSVGQVVRGLGELPGRKSAIIFSENIRIFQRGEQNPRIFDELQRLTDLTNRAGVVLYTIDPRGLPTLSLTAADKAAPDANLVEALSARRQEYFESQDGLSYLARETGGLFIRDTNDIAGGIREAMDDQSGYYLLGYTPQEGTFDKDLRNQKFHRISVRALRPGVQVRSRTGFFSVPDTVKKPAPRTRESQMLAALSSPFGASGVKVRLTSLFVDSPKLGPYVRSLLFIDAKDLTFVDEPDDWHKAVVDVATLTYRSQESDSERAGNTYTIRMRGETYKQALKDGFIYTVNHPIKKAGAFQMRAVVRDQAAQRLGSANQFIEVPDVKKGRLAISGIILKTASPELLKNQQLTANLAGESGQVQDYAEGSPAVRRFYQGLAVSYGYLVINPRLDSKTQQPQLDSGVRVFQNGKPIFTIKQAPMTRMWKVDERHVITGGVLRVGKNMMPGEYVLQVVVTDKLAKEKYRTATQWIDFEVVPGAAPGPAPSKGEPADPSQPLPD